MDVYKALRELHEERSRLDVAIAALEARIRTISEPVRTTRSRRGRRSMGTEERQEVSRRMSRYWAQRREMQQIQVTGMRLGPSSPASSQAIEGAA